MALSKQTIQRKPCVVKVTVFSEKVGTRPRFAVGWKTASPYLVVVLEQNLDSHHAEDTFNLTHLPTGYILQRGYTSVRDAMTAARMMAKTGVNWSSRNPKTIVARCNADAAFNAYRNSVKARFIHG